MGSGAWDLVSWGQGLWDGPVLGWGLPSHPYLLPTQDFGAQKWVVGVKAPRPNQQGAGGGLDHGGELGGNGDSKNICVLASQPLALILLIPWLPLFLGKLGVSGSCLPHSLGLGGVPPEGRPRPSAALGWGSELLDSLPTDSYHHSQAFGASVGLCVTGSGSVLSLSLGGWVGQGQRTWLWLGARGLEEPRRKALGRRHPCKPQTTQALTLLMAEKGKGLSFPPDLGLI